MIKILFIPIFLLLAASFAHGQACGPPDYSCFNNNTQVVNYPATIPSWGPNTCDSTSIYTMAQCGNLTGAGTVQTPSDFGTTITRCTDMNTDGNPAHLWQTADEPSVNLWNTDDTALSILFNGGNQFIFLWDGTRCQILTPNVSFPAGTVWSRTQRDHVYTLDNSTGPGIYLKDNTINLVQGSGGISNVSTLFDFAGTNCLANSKNGTGGSADTFPLNQWTGALSSADGNTFAAFFSLLAGQGSGYFAVIWSRGQNGCDLWNTLTGDVTHTDGTPAVTTDLGTISDAQWNGPSCPGGSCGGQADRFKIHDGNMPNITNSTMAGTQSNFVYGTYSVGIYIWPKGTNNVQLCGIGAPDWKAGHNYAGTGDRILPVPINSTHNPGGYIYQIINHTGGQSSPVGSEPTWLQAPGSDTTDGPLTWRNLGVGSVATPSLVYACDGHSWKGYTGLAMGKKYTFHYYTDPKNPLTILGNNAQSVGDQHFGNTNDNTTDTNWIWVASSVVGTNVDLLHGSQPGALYGEGFFVAPPYCAPGILNGDSHCPVSTLGQLRRAFHGYNSGWAFSFDVRYGMAVMSQTGKYAMIPADAFGQLGSRQGQAKCNIGGPDWGNNDTGNPTNYSVGFLLYPNLGQANNGNFIYKVLNCTANGGNGSSCTTGTPHPTWPQGGTPGTTTVTENSPGTITWTLAPDINVPTTAAIENCRSDVFIANMFRGTGTSKQNTIIQGNTKIQGNTIIQ